MMQLGDVSSCRPRGGVVVERAADALVDGEARGRDEEGARDRRSDAGEESAETARPEDVGRDGQRAGAALGGRDAHHVRLDAVERLRDAPTEGARLRKRKSHEQVVVERVSE